LPDWKWKTEEDEEAKVVERRCVKETTWSGTLRIISLLGYYYHL
jgi:hypothetical protein